MKILQSITIKQVLTEKSKKELYEKYRQEILQLEKECQQLQFEERKQGKNHPNSLKIKEYYHQQMHERLEKKKTIEFQLEQLHILPLGTEVKEQEMLSLLDVQVGDNWDTIKKGRDILIEDGIVVEIR